MKIKELLHWYFSRRALPFWIILLLDACIVLFSGLLAHTVHYGASDTLAVFSSLVWTLLIALLCYVVGFRLFHTYDGILRFSSFSDLMRVSKAVVVGVVLFAMTQWILSDASWLLILSDLDMLLFALIVVVFLWTLRVWVKTLYEGSLKSNKRQPAYILGVREGGAALAKNINSSADSPYKVAGFTADPEHIEARRLMGVAVHPFDRSLPTQMLRDKAEILIVSPLMMDYVREHAEMIEFLADHGIKIMVIYNAKEWDGKSDLKTSDLKPVNVEDLLPREKIEVDLAAAANLLQNSVVLVTGAAGSIGSEIVQQVASYSPAHLILVDQAETPLHDIRLMMKKQRPEVQMETIVGDISNYRRMESLFEKYRPQYVFHAAAYKHVPMMEDNPYESVVNNVHGTKIVADLAVRFGTRKFVMVSTDKAVNPTNVMGCSKRICEIYVQALDKAVKEGKVKGDTRFVTTRFGNVLGSNGSVIPIFRQQILKGGPVTVTHPDIIRYFMLIPEACRLVIEAGTMGNGGEIYVFDMGKPVKIVDLAKRMIKLSGAKNIEIVFTGLRGGEKLYEEVLSEEEVTLPTRHPKIKVAKVREYDFGEVALTIGNLIALAHDSDDMKIVAAMKAIVPEFKSQHSIYEQLEY